MIANKKLKQIDQKTKNKVTESQAKKVKKAKNGSPNKLKATPEKKKVKKDENNNGNKPVNGSIYQPQYYKSKQSQRPSNIHKKSQNHNKSKLLTTSPIYFDHQKSRSKSKSKSKSKSISVSKLNTYRSTQDKQFNKSINKKLFSQTKQNKQRSKSKSKSKSRLKYEKQVSPLKEIKRFNVADRQIKYNKNETNQLKKTLKKKIQNTRSKGQAFIYPTQPIQQPVQQPKVKLKKKVPQIKTQFSERRGSYFDENLLKKLEINHQQGNKNEPCPFMHIRSNFQQKMQQNIPFHSKSDSKVPIDEVPQSFSSQNQQVELFKREQQRRWNLMLSELKNLKNQPKVAERIDVLIQYLNQNYVSLQERAHELSSKDPKSIQSNPLNQQFQSIINDTHKNSMAQEMFHQLLLPTNITFNKNQNLYNNQHQKQPTLNKVQVIHKSNQSSFKFLSPIAFDNNPKSSINSQQKQVKQQPKITNQQQKELNQQNELAFKRSNNINLSEFYNFNEKKQIERKVQFQPFLKMNHEQGANYSLELIKYESQHRISDKNILNDLNILQNSQDFLEIPQAYKNKNKNSQFMQQMQKATVDENGFNNFNSFHNEVRMNEQMSSQSMLLNMSDQNIRRGQKLVDEIQQTLIMQFCVNILRSKVILHNFITTYSELVQNNVINVQMCFSDPKNAIQSSNQYVRNIVSRLVNHIEVNYKQEFMDQIKLPFQCKPIEILRYIRSSEDQVVQSSFENQSNPLQVPYFNEEMIEEFEINVLKNQYFIPGYFSFNHCIYDEFNDIVEQLRPFGSRGKAIFSLELSHPIVNFEVAKAQIFTRAQQHLSQKYYQQKIADEKYPSQQGLFQLVYYTSLQLVEMIIQLEVQVIAKTFNTSNLKKHAR